MGELILGRKDDGTLEVIRADDEITISDEHLADIPADEMPDYYLERDVLHVNASNERLAYVLVEHDRLTNSWRAVRTANHEGR